MNKLMFKFADDYKATSVGNLLCVEFKKGELVYPVFGIDTRILIRGYYGLFFFVPTEKGIVGDFEFLRNKAKEEADRVEII